MPATRKKANSEKTLSSKALIPNEKTIKAMKAARKGELVTVDKISNLLTSLNAE